MGYHDGREIPNYWAYARHFVLQDHMFQSDTSWSLPSHLYLVSGWSARCAKRGKPMSCRASSKTPARRPASRRTRPEPLRTTTGPTSHTSSTSTTSAGATTSSAAASPTARDGTMLCGAVPQSAKTPGIWNPLPWFTSVKQDRQVGNVAAARVADARGPGGNATGRLVDHARLKRSASTRRAG